MVDFRDFSFRWKTLLERSFLVDFRGLGIQFLVELTTDKGSLECTYSWRCMRMACGGSGWTPMSVERVTRLTDAMFSV